MANHYETLGITREATDKEIKQAFRAMSMKYHPDRVRANDAEEQEKINQKMQEINEAYEILSDETKRQAYHMELDGIGGPFANFSSHGGFPFANFSSQGGPFGQGGVHFVHRTGQGGPFGQPDIGNIFEMLFSQGGAGPHVFFQHAGPPPIISKTIEITLAQAYAGCTIPYEIERWVQDGENKITEMETITLNIPAGVDSGVSMVIKGKGNAFSDTQKGDIKITVQVVNNTPFHRQGNDLHLKKQITLKEALCGFQIQFVHLNGKTLVMNNSSTIIFSGARKVINGLGMTSTGNLVVEFDVVFPTELTQEQRDVIAKTL